MAACRVMAKPGSLTVDAGGKALQTCCPPMGGLARMGLQLRTACCSPQAHRTRKDCAAPSHNGSWPQRAHTHPHIHTARTPAVKCPIWYKRQGDNITGKTSTARATMHSRAQTWEQVGAGRHKPSAHRPRLSALNTTQPRASLPACELPDDQHGRRHCHGMPCSCPHWQASDRLSSMLSKLLVPAPALPLLLCSAPAWLPGCAAAAVAGRHHHDPLSCPPLLQSLLPSTPRP